MTELKLLRMEPILLRSTLSTAAAGAATGGVTERSVFAGTAEDTAGWAGRSICSSTEQKNTTVRES